MPSFSIFASRTFWTVVVMFLIGGFNGIMAFMPAGIQTILMAVLGLLATYFHVNPSQRYNPPQA